MNFRKSVILYLNMNFHNSGFPYLSVASTKCLIEGKHVITEVRKNKKMSWGFAKNLFQLTGCQ